MCITTFSRVVPTVCKSKLPPFFLHGQDGATLIVYRLQTLLRVSESCLPCLLVRFNTNTVIANTGFLLISSFFTGRFVCACVHACVCVWVGACA